MRRPLGTRLKGCRKNKGHLSFQRARSDKELLDRRQVTRSRLSPDWRTATNLPEPPFSRLADCPLSPGESRGGNAPFGAAATSRHYLPFLCLLSFPAEKKVWWGESPQVLYSISSPMAEMACSRFWRISAAFSSVPGLFS